VQAEGSIGAVEALTRGKFDLVITDVDMRLFAVTDMHLDGSAGNGLDVGRLLKKHHAELRVLLSSDGGISADELVGAIDLPIGKDPVALTTLQELYPMLVVGR